MNNSEIHPVNACIADMVNAFRPLVAFLALSLTCLYLAPAALSQDTPDAPPPSADPADVESIDAIMTAVYDVISGPAGEVRDWDRFRSLFRPEAQLIPIGRRAQDAPPLPIYWSVDFYITNIGPQLERSGFFEIESNRVQEVWGNMAHAFSTYESRRSPDDVEPFARGINSFQLSYDGERWWVVNIFWQQESAAMPIPAEYESK